MTQVRGIRDIVTEVWSRGRTDGGDGVYSLAICRVVLPYSDQAVPRGVRYCIRKAVPIDGCQRLGSANLRLQLLAVPLLVPEYQQQTLSSFPHHNLVPRYLRSRQGPQLVAVLQLVPL